MPAPPHPATAPAPPTALPPSCSTHPARPGRDGKRSGVAAYEWRGAGAKPSKAHRSRGVSPKELRGRLDHKRSPREPRASARAVPVRPGRARGERLSASTATADSTGGGAAAAGTEKPPAGQRGKPVPSEKLPNPGACPLPTPPTDPLGLFTSHLHLHRCRCTARTMAGCPRPWSSGSSSGAVTHPASNAHPPGPRVCARLARGRRG
jgi:hypothetical protein